MSFFRRAPSEPSRLQVRMAEARARIIEAKSSVTATGQRGWAPAGTVWPAPSDSFSAHDDRALAACMSKLDIVYMCIQELQTGVCSAPLEVCYDGPDGVEVIDGHEALRIFCQNPDFSYSDIFAAIVARLKLTGAAYSILGLYRDVLGAGEFTPVPTHRMKLKSRGPTILGYDYLRDGAQPMPLTPEEVCTIMHRDPLAFHTPLSPLQAAARAVNTDEQRADTTLQVLRNKAVPGGFLETEFATTKGQRDTLTDSFDQATGASSGTRGRVVALPKGVKFAAGIDTKDVDFSVLNSLAETRICGVFQVPPVIIGALVGIELGGKYSNYGEARKSFYAETIMPLWQFIADGLTRAGILGNPELYFRFDASEVKELQEDQTAKVTRAGLAFEKGIATLNESRAIAGLPALDGPEGDEFKAPPPAPNFGQPFAREEAPEGKRGCGCSSKVGAIGAFPEEHALEGALRTVFAEQEGVLAGQVLRGKLSGFDLSDWEERMKDACRPSLKRVWEKRVRTTLERIAGRVRQKTGRADLEAKAVNIIGGFDIIRREALELLEKQLSEFAKSVNLTTAADLDKAIKGVVATAEGDNTIPALRRAVSEVFTDATEARAKAIAVTESSRATHDGGILAASKSGVVRGFMPEVSADACEVCQAHVGEYVPLGKAAEQMGSYERDLPPWHPSDRCSYTEVLDIDEVPNE